MKTIERIGAVFLSSIMVLNFGACGKKEAPTIETRVDVITERVGVDDSTVDTLAEHTGEQEDGVSTEANMILTICLGLSPETAESCVNLLHELGAESISVVSSFGENTLDVKDSASPANRYHVVIADGEVKTIQYGDDQGPVLYSANDKTPK